MDVMQKGLSASWMRNAVIRNNIANIETPGFKASTVEFESLFARAIEEGGFVSKTTHPNHREFGSGNLNAIQPRLIQSKELSMRADGNNVDIESENVKLAQNSLYYNTLTTKLNGELARIKLAARDGR